MMTGGDDKLFAWLDGELGPDEAAEVERQVAAEPRLAQLAEQHRAMQTRLKAAFDPLVAEPVPERLAALADRSNVVDFGAARNRRQFGFWPQGFAIAASLAAGILVGTLIPRGPQGEVSAVDGRLYAAAALDEGLSATLASQPAGPVRIGITFRATDGAMCRTFDEGRLSGLACREQQRWAIRGLVNQKQAADGDYRMAAGMDPALATLVGSTMAGAPFDAVQEREARQRGWR